MKKKHKRIGIVTGGGDCPGLNAVIRAATKCAYNYGWEVYGIHDGYDGMFSPDKCKRLYPHHIKHILHQGGTILGTCNKGSILQAGEVEKAARQEVDDEVKRHLEAFKARGLDALIAIGGDGTLSIGYQLFKGGIPLVGVPKTIDNDLSGTVITFGFDTAVSTATDALDKLHTTARSHERVMVVEVMGRYAGWIALNSGIAGGADIILIPEIPFKIKSICRKVKQRFRDSEPYCMVVVAEGAAEEGGGLVGNEQAEAHREIKLGGIGDYLAKMINQETEKESRSLVLGHLQRGGTPTTFDRLISTRFGAAATRLLKNGDFGKMVCLQPPRIEAISLKEAISRMKRVDVNSDTVLTARELGISFGD